MNETRVNLKHLLEDIRDSYALSIEQVIIVELIANSLDGGASRIDFTIDPLNKNITIVDNGRGMRRPELKNYHNIATTTKTRGKGIGFAGVGAKLSLLLAQNVITQSMGGRGTISTTDWHLSSDSRAPWKYITHPEIVNGSHGTAVSITLVDPESKLVNEKFVHDTIKHQFYPLLLTDFFAAIYRYIYAKGVEFFVNNIPVTIDQQQLPPEAKIFKIIFQKKTKHLAGFGYIATSQKQDLSYYGLSISTYGKVIKSGWEWIGLNPSIGKNIYGFIEIPALSEILTINKMDFLRDSTSLKKYYRYRKAIQNAILPALEELGQYSPAGDTQKNLRPLARQLEHTLRHLAGDFPELIPLFGIKNLKNGTLSTMQINNKPLVGVIESTDKENLTSNKQKPDKEKHKLSGGERKKHPKGPAVSIGLEDSNINSPMARMVEDKILINILHPAYTRADKERSLGYHMAFCVALSLSNFIDDEHSPRDFIDQFISSWGKENVKQIGLF